MELKDTDKLMVTTEELQYILSCGRRNAEKIGSMANAEVEIGNYRRCKSYKGFIFTSKLGYPITHEGIVASLKRIVAHCNEEEIIQAEKREEHLCYCQKR